MLKVKGSVPAGILVGVLLSIVVSILLAGCTAALVLEGHAGIEKIHYFTMGIQYIAVSLGNIIAAKMTAKAPALICGIVTVGYVFILIAVNIMFLQGDISSVVSVLLMSILGWATACALCISKPRNKKYRKVRK